MHTETHVMTDDLATLNELDENILLKALQNRYNGDAIYTYIGDILIALNPYKPLPIYGSEVVSRYCDIQGRSKLPPHIYAVSDVAYQALCRTGKLQCCVVSGESGAGKTETTKLMVRHIVHQCQKSQSKQTDLHEKIIEVNPLLESFGNAQTLMNNNSSRFGKYIELMISRSGDIHSARIDEYLLEKSRVCAQGPKERNFHVFYIMFAGLTEPELRKLLLDRPETYRVIRPSDGTPVYKSAADFQYHADMYERLKQIMITVGFTQENIRMIFALLAAILHISNIKFLPDLEFEGVYIENEYELEIASTLLGVHPEALASVLISETRYLRGERIVTMKLMAQANDSRDALAKAVYSRLFSWIVRQVNELLKPDNSEIPRSELHTIGILDIFGFENFSVNSYEQLCINVANEQLQYYFNQHIFSWELMSYQAEGLKPTKIKFTNNKPVLDMFLERPMGLFSLLDEESRLHRTTDMTLIDKFNKHLSKNDYYIKYRHREPSFSVVHYAGEVTYRAEGFLEKNRDTFGLNLTKLLQKSASWIVYELFTAQINDTGNLEIKYVLNQ